MVIAIALPVRELMLQVVVGLLARVAGNMASDKKITKKEIIAGFILAGLLVGGIIMINQEDESIPLTVQEWRMLVEIYNEETQGGIILEDVKEQSDILDRLDEKILERVQQRAGEDKNLIEGLLIKRSPKNKEVIKKLRQ